MKTLTNKLWYRHGVSFTAGCIILVHFFFLPMVTECETTKLVFSTWDIFEVDKCASIWLIKRFIDEKAEIRVFTKGEVIKEGIQFDTPEAEFRRYYNVSTFETLLRHYKIEDARCKYLGKVVYDIEINTWEKKVMKESRTVLKTINNIISEEKKSDKIIEKSLLYFDTLYEGLPLD